MSQNLSASLLAISGEMTIYRIAEIRSQLDALLAQSTATETFTLNLAEATECDGAGLQLLTAFAGAVAAVGASLALTAVPETIAALLREYGIERSFARISSAAEAAA